MKKYLRRMIRLFLPYRTYIGIIITIIIFQSVISYIQPYISRDIIDVGFVEKKIKYLIMLCVAYLLLTILHSVLEYFKEKKRLRLYNGFKYDLEKETFKHLLRIESCYFNDKNISMIHQNIKYDSNYISSIASSAFFRILTSFITALAGAIALIRMEWKLIIVIIFFFPINCLVTYVLSKKNYKIVDEYIDKLQSYNRWFADVVTGYKEVRLFGVQASAEQKLEKKHRYLKKLDSDISLVEVEQNEISNLLLTSVSIVLYIVSGFLMINNEISLGEVIAFQTYSLIITNPIIEGLGLLVTASGILPSIKRYFDFIDYKEEDEKGDDCEKFISLSFENVSLSYDDKEVISNLSFEVRNGSKVVLLGDNGAGKTTILNLILRLISPQEGLIKYNDRSIYDYNILSYRKMFSVVSQNVYLFNMSIKDNICLGLDIDDKKIDDVIKSVNLDSLVSERGLDYIIGENGLMLSGGQKQKIAIARALIQDRPIIILDEATSNLDMETVSMISDMFDSSLKNKTILCVTHTNRIADCFEQRICI